MYICNRNSTEKISSNAELKSKYLTRDELQVIAINTSLNLYMRVLLKITSSQEPIGESYENTG